MSRKYKFPACGRQAFITILLKKGKGLSVEGNKEVIVL
jgi:hypothetical protein